MKNRSPKANGQIGRIRLMDAAIRLFALRGLDGASVNEIGREAGVTSQLIYHYFGNGKRGLYREAYLRSFRHVMEASVRNLPPDPDPSGPAARMQAIEGLAIFIRNIVTAGGNALDSEENEMLLLSYRETFDPPDDLKQEIMDLLEISASRLRALLVVLLPKVTRLSISLLGSAITGALYHERMITGILNQRRKGLSLSLEDKAKFYISYTLRVLGVDRELPPDHPYCEANLDRNIFNLY